jgi:uncharacterized protein (TIGR02996 family)
VISQSGREVNVRRGRMDREQGFLDAIWEHPDGDVPRLIYTDVARKAERPAS